MNDSSKLKIRAIRLRHLGKSYKEISDELKIAKSTLSYWLKGIKLKPKHQKRLYTKQIEILSRGPKSQKERRKREVNLLIKQARNEVVIPIDSDVYKYFGVGLYWAEGSKSKMMQITNSDPYLILFMVRWLDKVFNIKPTCLKARLNIYPQQNNMDIVKFWSDLTDIPLSNFGKTFIKPISTGYKKNNLYFGTIRIYVPKSTNFKYKMLGWLQALLHDFKIDVGSIEKKWLILKSDKRSVNLRVNSLTP